MSNPLPFSRTSHLAHLRPDEAFLVVLCCADSVLGYWSFTQALKIWRAVQVGSAIALAPSGTPVVKGIVVSFGCFPDVIKAVVLNRWGVFGVATVVLSATGVRFSDQKKTPQKTVEALRFLGAPPRLDGKARGLAVLTWACSDSALYARTTGRGSTTTGDSSSLELCRGALAVSHGYRPTRDTTQDLLILPLHQYRMRRALQTLLQPSSRA
ncbi:hypothetical protein B0G81_5009 [Paraburkholderia sp. BL6665CI2N2]|nr:hypothetical protein B0G81_5009 [Paraburkholderia sp. BL6665CI2N2]